MRTALADPAEESYDIELNLQSAGSACVGSTNLKEPAFSLKKVRILTPVKLVVAWQGTVARMVYLRPTAMLMIFRVCPTVIQRPFTRLCTATFALAR